MFSDNDLRELLSYQASFPVLSVFLNTEPESGNADTHRLRLRSMLKDVELTDDVAAVIRFFDQEHDWSGRSVIVFSCVPENYFKAYTLAVPIRSRIRINSQPFVKPLADLLDSYGGYGVALVDKQGARLFHFHLGELREQEGVMGETVRHSKRGGGSTATGRRGGNAGRGANVDEVTERNMRETMDFATQFFKENKVRRLLIGGTEETTALFRSRLPKSWQSLVVGTFPSSMVASHAEILEKSMQIGLNAELLREAKLIQTVKTEASKGRNGVLGLDNVLANVSDGRIQILVIRDGYRSAGYECRGCGFLTLQHLEKCPFCGNSFLEIPDAVEMAVRNVMKRGGEVEVIRAGQTPSTDDHDFNIGGLLRY